MTRRSTQTIKGFITVTWTVVLDPITLVAEYNCIEAYKIFYYYVCPLIS